MKTQDSCDKFQNEIKSENLFYIYFYLFILFLAMLGLCHFTQAFCSCTEQGLLFIPARGLLIAVASLVVEHRL